MRIFETKAKMEGAQSLSMKSTLKSETTTTTTTTTLKSEMNICFLELTHFQSSEVKTSPTGCRHQMRSGDLLAY